jgi:hypothetical protein
MILSSEVVGAGSSESAEKDVKIAGATEKCCCVALAHHVEA